MYLLTRFRIKHRQSALNLTAAVVLDRKADKTCDTGLFELFYKQQQINDAPTSEVSLSVEGKKIKRIPGPRVP
jgi:hypothetical protein